MRNSVNRMGRFVVAISTKLAEAPPVVTEILAR